MSFSEQGMVPNMPEIPDLDVDIEGAVQRNRKVADRDLQRKENDFLEQKKVADLHLQRMLDDSQKQSEAMRRAQELCSKGIDTEVARPMLRASHSAFGALAVVALRLLPLVAADQLLDEAAKGDLQKYHLEETLANRANIPQHEAAYYVSGIEQAARQYVALKQAAWEVGVKAFDGSEIGRKYGEKLQKLENSPATGE